MKILISAYTCSPYHGSEFAVGWNFVHRLAQDHELVVISEKEKCEADITRYFTEHPEERNIRFYFIEKMRHKRLRKIWPPSYYWFYQTWQKKAYVLAQELCEKETFDLIHQLTMIGYREPGYLWQLGLPFVWGPLAGTNLVPWHMLASMSLKGCLYYTGRNILNLWQLHTSSRVKKAMRHADCLIAATSNTQKDVRKYWHKNSVLMPEVGLEQDETELVTNRRQAGEKLKICFSGTFAPRKSLNLLLEAMAVCEAQQNTELHITGDGECRKKWMSLGRRLHLENIVWHGWLAREESIGVMQQCHLFVLPSLSEATSTVLLEALSNGLPVTALDHCGFSNVITAACGFKIPIHGHRQVVKDLSAIIDRIESDEDFRYRLAQGACARAKELSWSKKIVELNEIYRKICRR